MSLCYSNDLPYSPPVPPKNPTSTDPPQSPGSIEDETFLNNASVADWRSHESEGGWRDRLRSKVSSPNSELVRFLSFTSSQIVKYALQGLASLALARIVIDRGASGASPSSNSNDTYLSTMTAGFQDRSTALLGEAAHAALQEYEEVENRKYKLPFDYDIRHPSQRVSTSIRKAVPYFREAVRTLRRRSQSAQGEEPEIRTWLKSDSFPKYYSNSFHYQSDGWMSTDSAEIYETSTNTLFLGRQDFMQKTALSAISSFYGNSPSDTQMELKVLELGCGTGRFSVYMRDSVREITNSPNLEILDYTLVDLSPFYLERARKNHADYSRFKSRSSSLPSTSVSYVQGNGESLSMASDSFDVVICMYTFHELPPSARANFAKEMSRLAKKGGLIVFTDSIQKGDRPVLDDSIGAFKEFNEPFYGTYIEEDVGKLFEQEGVERVEKWLLSVTKTLTFKK